MTAATSEPHRSLSGRLTLIYGVFAFALLLVCAGGVGAVLYVNQIRAQEDQAAVAATLISDASRGSLLFADRRMLDRALASLSNLDQIAAACLTDKEGTPLSSYRSATTTLAGPACGPSTANNQLVQSVQWQQEAIGTLTLTLDTSVVQRELLAVLLPVGVALVLLALGSLFVVRRLSLAAAQPLRTLADDAANLQPLDGERLTSPNDVESAALARAFNAVIDRLSDARHATEAELGQRREAQRREREAQALLNDIINTVPYIIFAIARNGTVLFANRSVARLYNTSVSELTSGRFEQGYTGRRPDGLLFAGAQGATQEQTLWLGEPHGDRRRLQVSRLPLSAADAELVVAVDITDAHRLEMQLQFSQRMELVGTLAGGIAHDFNNLLTPILGYASILVDRSDLPGDVLDNLDAIETAALRAREVVQQVLHFSSQSDEPVDVELDLRDLVAEAVRLVSANLSGELEIRVDTGDRVSPVAGNSGQISQVLVNLLSNAINAIGDRAGAIDVRVFTERRVLKPGAGAIKVTCIEVTDTGPGMSPEVLDHVFEPFFTTKSKQEGTGLGLAVALGIVHRHGGEIIAESKPGLGASFTVCLPISADRSPTMETPIVTLPSAQGEHILLVDDEEPVLTVTRELLINHGYDVTTASNASEALEIYQRRGAEIDLVLTDNSMPGMTGLELARQIRLQDPKAPIIVITGLVGLEVDFSEVDRCIVKPVSGADLSAAIQQVLAGCEAA